MPFIIEINSSYIHSLTWLLDGYFYDRYILHTWSFRVCGP